MSDVKTDDYIYLNYVCRGITVEQIEALWRPMTEEEKPRAQKLIEVVNAIIDDEAERLGRNPDNLGIRYHARLSVVTDIIARTLMTSTNQEPMTQITQSAGGYSTSGTYLVPGGGLYIKKSEWARLGLRRQRIGVIDFYGGPDQRDCC